MVTYSIQKLNVLHSFLQNRQDYFPFLTAKSHISVHINSKCGFWDAQQQVVILVNTFKGKTVIFSVIFQRSSRKLLSWKMIM